MNIEDIQTLLDFFKRKKIQFRLVEKILIKKNWNRLIDSKVYQNKDIFIAYFLYLLEGYYGAPRTVVFSFLEAIKNKNRDFIKEKSNSIFQKMNPPLVHEFFALMHENASTILWISPENRQEHPILLALLQQSPFEGKIKRHQVDKGDLAFRDYAQYCREKVDVKKKKSPYKIAKIFKINGKAYSLPFSLLPMEEREGIKYFALLDDAMSQAERKKIYNPRKSSIERVTCIVGCQENTLFFIKRCNGYVLKKIPVRKEKWPYLNNHIKNYKKELSLNQKMYPENNVMGRDAFPIFFILQPFLGVGLKTFLKKNTLSVAMSLYLAREVIKKTIAFIEKTGNFHRDLKIQNFVIEEYKNGNHQLSLIDFENADAPDQIDQLAGTLLYAPPEYIDLFLEGFGKREAIFYEKIEVFFLGVILAFLGGYQPDQHRRKAYDLEEPFNSFPDYDKKLMIMKSDFNNILDRQRYLPGLQISLDKSEYFKSGSDVSKAYQSLLMKMISIPEERCDLKTSIAILDEIISKFAPEIVDCKPK